MNQDPYTHPLLNRDKLIFVVHPEPLVCETICVLLRLNGFQTEFAVDALSLFTTVKRRRPDLIILNSEVGEERAPAILARLNRNRPVPPIILLCGSDDVAAAAAGFRAGVADVVTFPLDHKLLTVLVGEFVSAGVQVRPRGNGTPTIAIRGYENLTPREREVLQLIVAGQSNKDAGRELQISHRTIEVHRARAMEKLGARNTAELVRIVLAT